MMQSKNLKKIKVLINEESEQKANINTLKTNKTIKDKKEKLSKLY